MELSDIDLNQLVLFQHLMVERTGVEGSPRRWA